MTTLFGDVPDSVGKPFESRRLRYPRWHVCHHCRGKGCEVCEEAGGWFETAAQRQGRLLMWRVGRTERGQK